MSTRRLIWIADANEEEAALGVSDETVVMRSRGYKITAMDDDYHVVLTTKNPTKHPLPKLELLELQFLLQRVSVLAGRMKGEPFEGDFSGPDERDSADVFAEGRNGEGLSRMDLR
jgi:hypothetical protein